MDKGDFVLFSYAIEKNGQGKPLYGKDVQKHVKAKSLGWVHLDAYHDETPEWLRENVSYLDDTIIDALLASETRPRVTFHEKGAMVILRGMNFNQDADPEDMISIRLWIDESRIISVQRRPLKAVEDIKNALENGHGPKDSGTFLAMLCGFLFTRMQPVLSDINEQVDEIEENILEDSSPEIRQNLGELRKKIIIFKRYISPQKDVMAILRNSDLNWLGDNHAKLFQENYDRLTRYIEDFDMVRERSQIIKEEHMALVSDRMNKNMYSLSIIAGIFLPLGFITGLLGINVGGMPGVDNENAFMIVSIACVFCGLGFIGLFKLLKWI